MPFFDSITSEQALGEGRQVITISQSSAISFGELIVDAPRATNSFTKESFKSLTVRSKPFLKRLPASLPPALPRPINPTFM